MFRKFATYLVFAFIAGVTATSSVQAKQLTVVRMATPALGLWQLPFLVGEREGFFAKNGLDVKIHYMNGGSQAAAALAGGDVDMMASAVSGVMIIHSKGLPIKALCAEDGVRTFALVVDAKRHANVTSVRQMKGFKIATARRGSDSYLVARSILSAAHMLDKVTLISIGGYQNVLRAIENGEVDGGMELEPFRTIGIRAGVIKPVVDLLAGQGPAILRKRIWTAVSTTDSFLKKNPQAAHAMVRAMTESVAYIDSNQAGALKVAEHYFPKMDPAVLRSIIHRLTHLRSGHGFLTTLSPEAIRLENKFLLEQHLISKAQPYDSVVATSMKADWGQ